MTERAQGFSSIYHTNPTYNLVIPMDQVSHKPIFRTNIFSNHNESRDSLASDLSIFEPTRKFSTIKVSVCDDDLDIQEPSFVAATPSVTPPSEYSCVKHHNKSAPSTSSFDFGPLLFDEPRRVLLHKYSSLIGLNQQYIESNKIHLKRHSLLVIADDAPLVICPQVIKNKLVVNTIAANRFSRLPAKSSEMFVDPHSCVDLCFSSSAEPRTPATSVYSNISASQPERTIRTGLLKRIQLGLKSRFHFSRAKEGPRKSSFSFEARKISVATDTELVTNSTLAKYKDKT